METTVCQSTIRKKYKLFSISLWTLLICSILNSNNKDDDDDDDDDNDDDDDDIISKSSSGMVVFS